MKRASLFLISLSIYSLSPIRGQPFDSSCAPFSPSQEAVDALGVTTRIVKQTYCAGDDETATLQLTLRLRFMNSGKDNIILYRGCNEVSKIMVNSEHHEAEEGHFESEMSITPYSNPPMWKIEGEPRASFFVFLKLGKYFDTQATVPVPFRRPKASGRFGGVSPGKHVLQVMVTTWPRSKDSALDLGERWHEKGTLWTKPITSTPMAFAVTEPRKLNNCD